ncbi:MAG: 3-dehydroquinate synthase [Lachnospiraceae bacterium]|nr:3-dehydroquinate synthase [Lachnospiraceae bacterium]
MDKETGLISLPIQYEGEIAYDILIGQGFEALSGELKKEKYHLNNRKACIVSDRNVAPLYGEALAGAVEAKKVYQYAFLPGEEHKNLDALSGLFGFLIEKGFDRTDLILALGGGVVGDMAGFAASCYLRGIDFIQVPTTLLAECDSSIGGKTAVDFQGYKNMVGAFYMPKLVYMNMDTLASLEERQFLSGLAETLKHGLIKDADYFNWLLVHRTEILVKDPKILSKMIFRSCQIKKEVVEKDPKEKGERALLNFGHTIGHAIEKDSDFSLLHGECVAIGCVAACFLSWKKGLLSEEDYQKVKQGFASFGLPVAGKIENAEHMLSLTKSDKKMQSGKIKFILLSKIGAAFIDREVSDQEILEAIQAVSRRGKYE